MKVEHSFSERVSFLVPDVLEQAHAEVEGFITTHTDRSAQHVTAELVADSHSLVAQFGKPVEQALSALLCDDSELRPALNEALGGGVRSGVALVVPLLISSFALAPAVALVVATLVIKTFAARGQKALCAELESRAAKSKAKSIKRPSQPRPLTKAGTRQPKSQVQAPVKTRPQKPARTGKPGRTSQ